MGCVGAATTPRYHLGPENPKQRDQLRSLPGSNKCHEDRSSLATALKARVKPRKTAHGVTRKPLKPEPSLVGGTGGTGNSPSVVTSRSFEGAALPLPCVGGHVPLPMPRWCRVPPELPGQHFAAAGGGDGCHSPALCHLQ